MILMFTKLRMALRLFLWSRKLMKSQVAAPEVIRHRVRNQDAVIILLHGFTGSNTETWGKFPELLDQNPALDAWDLVSLGYSTRLAPDLSGVWSADAPIDRL